MRQGVEFISLIDERYGFEIKDLSKFINKIIFFLKLMDLENEKSRLELEIK